MNSRLKLPIHVEVHLLSSCSYGNDHMHTLVEQYLSEIQLFSNGSLPVPSTLQSAVQSIQVCDLPSDQNISFWQAEFIIHILRYSEQGPDCDYLEGDEEIPAAEQWQLPNIYLKGLWDSIVVDHGIKTQLINYCCSSIHFADSQVDPNIISWNKMILLHGPPGTGKTSLCKALAQKVYIRNAHRYQAGLLFEVNAHSLFSKWFSESGKLVMKLFNHISEMAEDPTCLIVLLIDEVESIANARSSASKAGEPGDALRVVNAVLTSLDSLRRRANVLVLCTSNMLESLDEAFIDRLDLKIHLGNPSKEARYEILESCIGELENKGLIVHLEFPQSLEHRITLAAALGEEKKSLDEREHLLHQIAERAEGKSGRALRKLPLQTYANMIAKTSQVTVQAFLAEMLHLLSASTL